ncbi:GNAT family N-acetyltransferase [Gardnerella vaginalis]|uniref:Acetyltransferase, GNAT family n=1 Tax=Gardnerella vaginalis (strain ATCC 14019 / 317) TaxID=525284 RepID=E3DAN8_GARV3|nr:GNAT family N-acetyltransferase [Gardnerella vaginalis]ADP39132.1 acetyltransferase, GNAT family [Gardnerella vaginalis ATCC 14019]KOS08849.1 GNAT family acetyltransferase [Gardnerella vaginalis]RFT22457.1 GNAT family N-acetyltransferase [Gardnerella vaginalis]TCH81147.1 GNAT family N-acetyltransferase [Gardnerella vaginalis]TCH82390.1 GNAT family N-acetyltransferase [Gardnerella vaginalis ATCC 14018 = JCM 11026]
MKLIRPDSKYIQGYIEANEEDEIFRSNAERRFIHPETIIESSYNIEHGINLPENYVKATTFWLIDNEKFIGEINIRHELNSFLINYGGHIGYEIRQSECMKGYGTKMLSMALTYCKETLNLHKILITCDDDNIGSIRVIENNGGILENKVKNSLSRGNVTTRRYWINI